MKRKATEQKQAMIEALKPRYHVIEWEGGYCLYDTTKPARFTNAGDFVAQIYLSNDCTKYVYNKKRYESAEDLSKAIDEFIITLPFYWGNYDPCYKECYFMERCIMEYMERLGYERIWDPGKRDFGHYVIKGVYEDIVSEWDISVDYDKSTGRICKSLGKFKWVETKFDGLEDAIGAINATIAPECLAKGGSMISVLENMSNDRAGSASIGRIRGCNVYIENQKQKTIERLEEELKRLKGE